MAVRLSIGTGNFTAAGTWGLVDSTSFAGLSTTLSSLAATFTESSTFTPGAITVAGVAVKFGTRAASPSGTVSVHIAQGGVEVSGTLVTVNGSDLPYIINDYGWYYFRFATPVTLLAATAYSVGIKASSSAVNAGVISGTNWCRALVTTTTGAPAAGDDLIICGEYTGTGTSNSFTVTFDNTATTDFGSAPTASNSLKTPGLAICSKGTLQCGTADSTAYYLRLSNSIVVFKDGTFNIGTSGGEIPRTSSFEMYFDCGTNVDYGLQVNNGGTFRTYGLSRTSGKDIWYCKLNTDEAANSTSLGVDTDTGWLDNDVIAVASTTRAAGNSESGALNGAAGASTLTVDGFGGTGGGLAVAHSGTSPTQAEVILLTRNITIRGASATLQGYIYILAEATVNCNWTQFKWLGSATASKLGVSVYTTTGSAIFDYCSFHNFLVSGSIGVSTTNSSNANNITVKRSAFYGNISGHIAIAATTGKSITIDSNICIRTTGSNTNGISLSDVGQTVTNNTVSGSIAAGIVLGELNTLGTFSGNISHSNGTSGIRINSGLYTGTILNCKSWRNTGAGIDTAGGVNVSAITFSGLESWGNTQGITFSCNIPRVVILSCTFSGDSTFAQSYGINIASSGAAVLLTILNCSFGVASGIYVAHSWSDIIIGSQPTYGNINIINTTLASTTETSGTALLGTRYDCISIQRKDTAAGSYETHVRSGKIFRETTTIHTGSQSMKLTPSSASIKLETYGKNGGFKVAVANGATVTPSVYVYEDASYNGARARLIVLQNDALGITADTVLDTATAASDGAWEQLTGTTAAVTDDGVLEFIVDCDGTAGNLFVDSFTVS